ncbi:MAG: DUF1573 domain-containing protein [Cytophagales bacterium]|nr:DUF1573 domain-containing protein [Cytophagales bacterium]MCA6373804.1 DUF1573 domain-containing protein [Cytophagales bacterium]MCA6374128.1 DUF1573 domain-containing protein [Cytophagales bacterium]MCA6381855.1 DUF1573 domain-containing protein [Cytophagales bacterium]
MSVARVLFLQVCIFVCYQVGICQVAEPLFFQDKSHDFGDVVEQNGPVMNEFIFFNKSTQPITILSVQPSCGCTTPGWTKEPIAPGKSGLIKASFDPKGRPGYFNKSLTVTTDFEGTAIILQIKGNVIDKKAETGPYDLVVEKGNLRFRNTSFNVGKVFLNKENPAVEFPLYNNSNDSIKILAVIAPPHIKLVYPKVLPPKLLTKFSIVYRAKVEGKYGFCSNSLTIKTTDKMLPEKQFPVYATVEEYFAPLTPDEQLAAPILVVNDYQLDFGKIRNGVEVTRSLKARNRGKKDLIIRHIQSNCTCLVVNFNRMKLKPNEEATIEFRFDPTGREGLQNKALTIYANDPVNPVQRILVKGYIDN